MTKAKTTFIMVILAPFFLVAQGSWVNPTKRCNTDQKMEEYFINHPSYENEIEESFKHFSRRKGHGRNNAVITIPVHVIIVHPPGQPLGSGDNLSLDHIISQIDVLNEDFRRLNPDAANTPAVFAAGDPMIEFCLATVDPNGNASDGVTRYATSQNFENNEFSIKGATGWDRNSYLNIWVAQLNGVLGYAYVPTTNSLPNATLDGVVVGTPYFGGPGYATGFPYDLGRTATHEIGHFLGLRHIWRNDGCGQDDGISDTPIQDDENFGCPNHPSPSCGNGGDMFMNYMDYVNDNCMNAFSVEQGNYMQTILSTSRSSLAGASGFACAAVDPLTFNLDDYGNPLCYQSNDGYIQVSATGGSGNYTFSINGGSANSSGSFLGLSAGSYILNVDDGSTILTLDVDLIEPDPLFVLLGEVQNNNCYGSSEGSVEIFGSGGTSLFGDYMYQQNLEQPGAENIFDELINDDYTFCVIDDNGCTSSIDIEITSPPALLNTSINTQQIRCFGDSSAVVQINASGGSPGYSYSIGAGFQANPIFNNLAAGQIITVVKDTLGCLSEDTISIFQPNQLLVDSTEIISVQCFGDSTGSIAVFPSGGTQPYQYVNSGDTSISNQFINIAAGEFIYSVVDTFGCLYLDTVQVDQSAKLDIEVNILSPIICPSSNDGIIEITSVGGQGDITYTLNGDTSATGVFMDLSEGKYEIVAIDSLNCVDSTFAIITESPPIALTPVISNLVCNGDEDGIIDLYPSGGTGPLLSSIAGGQPSLTHYYENLVAGTYSFVIIDSLNCRLNYDIELTQPEEIVLIENLELDECGIDEYWQFNIEIEGGISPYKISVDGVMADVDSNEIYLLEGSGNGTLSILVSDRNECTVDKTIPVNLVPPMSFSTKDILPGSCDSTILGEATLVVTGGTPPYNFEYDGTSNSTGKFVALYAGIHEIMVTDGNGCIAVHELSIPTNANGFEVLSLNKMNVLCHGDNNGSIEMIVQGGSGNVDYTMNGTTNMSGFFDLLGPGNYLIAVKDIDYECTLYKDFNISQPEELEATYSIDYITNTVTIEAKGGTPPYNFGLDSTTDMQLINKFQDVAPGTHTIYIIDANGCLIELPLLISSSDDHDWKSSLKLYPNPFEGQLTLELELPNGVETLKISLLDLNGKELFVDILDKVEGNKIKHTFFVQDLTKSIYILKLAVRNEITYRKVVLK